MVILYINCMKKINIYMHIFFIYYNFFAYDHLKIRGNIIVLQHNIV